MSIQKDIENKVSECNLSLKEGKQLSNEQLEALMLINLIQEEGQNE